MESAGPLEMVWLVLLGPLQVEGRGSGRGPGQGAGLLIVLQLTSTHKTAVSVYRPSTSDLVFLDAKIKISERIC